MKKLNTTLMIGFLVVVAACSSIKKTTPSAHLEPSLGGNTVTFSETAVPDSLGVNALKAEFPEVTLEKLKAGYKLYTEGACISCHKSFKINDFSVSEWKEILEDMSERAKLTETDKGNIKMYVLAIKAVQP